VSKTEAITAWRALCSADTPSTGDIAPRSVARVKHHGTTESTTEEQDHEDPSAFLVSPSGSAQFKNPLKDGRDVYLLRFETDRMLKTGRCVPNRLYTLSSRLSADGCISK
jgi:hypothetical protein